MFRSFREPRLPPNNCSGARPIQQRAVDTVVAEGRQALSKEAEPHRPTLISPDPVTCLAMGPVTRLTSTSPEPTMEAFSAPASP